MRKLGKIEPKKRDLSSCFCSYCESRKDIYYCGKYDQYVCSNCVTAEDLFEQQAEKYIDEHKEDETNRRNTNLTGEN